MTKHIVHMNEYAFSLFTDEFDFVKNALGVFQIERIKSPLMELSFDKALEIYLLMNELQDFVIRHDLIRDFTFKQHEYRNRIT